MNMEELEQAVLDLTSKYTEIDRAFKLSKLGIETTMVFRCAVSGLLYPDDYIKQWGRKYGIGLGPTVCSESLQTDYETPPPAIDSKIKSINQIMHPVFSSKCQMDWQVSPVEDYLENRAICCHEDEDMNLRAPILRGKQLLNKRSTLHLLQFQFERMKGSHATTNH